MTFAFVRDVHRAGFKEQVEAIWGWDEARQQQYVESLVNDEAVAIIEEAGTPIGYLCVKHEADHDFLDMIALAPAAQRRGLGTQLITEVIADATAGARQRGIVRIGDTRLATRRFSSSTCSSNLEEVGFDSAPRSKAGTRWVAKFSRSYPGGWRATGRR